MTFRSPSMLWLLALVPLAVLFLVWRERLRNAIGRRFVNERLRGGARAMRALRPWSLAAALVALTLAVAGPFAGYTLVPVVARETNRVLVMDVSNSMAAEDIGTSRLSAAKGLAIRIAQAQRGRTALVVFEGAPEVVSPLTSDNDAVAALIDTLTTGEVGQPGSDVGSAILAALQLIESDPAQKADIVVLSDGEEQGSRVDQALQRARIPGVPISTIVVGTARGARIPTPHGPLRNEAGEPVTTYARTEVMEAIAARTGGLMLENPFGEHSIDPLLRDPRNGTERQTHARVPVERYQWPLAGAFVALFAASLLQRGAE